MLRPGERFGLFLTRVGLGVFLLFWSLDKFAAPQGTQGIFAKFYFLEIPSTAPFVIGTLEAILSLAIIAGFMKFYSYGLGTIVHGVSTISTIPLLLSPFENHLFLAGVPVLTTFIGLFLLRDRDTLFSVDDTLQQ